MNRLLKTSLIVFVVSSFALADEQSNQRREEMAKRIAAIEIDGKNSKETKFGKQPLLRYSDPTRHITDATVWALGQKGRPQGIMVLERYENENNIEGRSFWSYEFTVTSPTVAETLQSNQLNWRPSGKQFSWVDIEAKSPSEKKNSRQRQLKQLARKFQFTEDFNNQQYKLRLMPRPLVQYEDPENGILNGSIFVLAHGTNAEALLILEANGKTKEWQAGFARLGAAALEAKYDKKTVWKVPFGFSRAYMTSRDFGEQTLATR